MAFQPVPNGISCEIRSTLFAQQVENIIYFEQAGTPTAADVQEVAEAVEAWFIGSILPNLGSNVIYREVYARSLVTAAAPEWTANTNTGDVGGNAAGTLPNNVTWAVKFTTGLTGRSTRGRNYIYGVPENMVGGNDVDPDWAAAIVAGYQDLLAAPFPTDFVWSVLSRVQNHVVLANGLLYPINTVSFTDTVVDSQRRRLPGRGA